MNNKYELRFVNESDAAEILAIYAPYVRDTIISFEYEVPDLVEFQKRIKDITYEYPFLVYTIDEKIVGYAYASKHRSRTAYQWSLEASVYLLPDVQGKGIAKALYDVLFDILRIQGYINVYAVIGLPNEQSVKFHRKMGFEDFAVFKKIGYKLGNWHDTHWMLLTLAPHERPPNDPIKITELKYDEAISQIINDANLNKLIT